MTGDYAAPRIVRVVTRCSSLDEFVASFARFVDDTSLFLVTATPVPATIVPFVIELVDGTIMLRGRGEVVELRRDHDGPAGRDGMRLRFLELTSSSREIHAAMLAARDSLEPKIQLATDAERDNDAVERQPTLPLPMPPRPPPRDSDDWQVLPAGHAAALLAPSVTLTHLPIVPVVPSGPARVARRSVAQEETAPRIATARSLDSRQTTRPRARPRSAGGTQERRGRTAQGSTPPESRTPGSPYTLPANPFGELTEDALRSFVECTLYEDTGSTLLDSPGWDPGSTIEGTPMPAQRDSGPRALVAPAVLALPAPPLTLDDSSHLVGRLDSGVDTSVNTNIDTDVSTAIDTGVSTAIDTGIRTAVDALGPLAPLGPEIGDVTDRDVAAAASSTRWSVGAALFGLTLGTVAMIASATGLIVGYALWGRPHGPVPVAVTRVASAPAAAAVPAVAAARALLAAAPAPTAVPDRDRPVAGDDAGPGTAAPIAGPAPLPMPVPGPGPATGFGLEEALAAGRDDHRDPLAEEDRALDVAAWRYLDDGDAPGAAMAAGPSPNADGDDDAAVTAAAPAEPSAPAAPSGCVARVDSDPDGVDVRWGDRDLGETPVVDTEVPCGPAMVMLVHPRYEAARRIVVAAPEVPATLDVRMSRPSARLSLRSKPPGAVFTVDGTTVAAGQTAAVRAFTHVDVTATLAGHRVWTRRVYVRGRTASVTARLRQLSRRDSERERERDRAADDRGSRRSSTSAR